MNKSVAIIIVTYNRCKLLKECLNSLFQQTYSYFEIILVDNNSSDNTPELISQQFISDSRLHYFRLAFNTGGAGGYYYGITQAMNYHCDYIWLMDDDVICDSNALENLIYAGNVIENFGFLAGKVLWTDYSLCKMNIPLFTGSLKTQYPQVRKATFVSLLIPWHVVETVGLPIREFFIWGDDQEYTERISRHFPCFYVAQSSVIHNTAHNFGSDIVRDSMQRIERYYYKYRNEFYISRHNGTVSCSYYLVRVIRDVIRIIAISNQKRKRLSILYKGFRDGFSFNPSIDYLPKEGLK